MSEEILDLMIIRWSLDPSRGYVITEDYLSRPAGYIAEHLIQSTWMVPGTWRDERRERAQ